MLYVSTARKIRKKSKSNVVVKSITFDDYTQCLFDEMTRKQSRIRSKLHEVYTISETKIALSPYDDKRYIGFVFLATLRTLYIRCKQEEYSYCVKFYRHAWGHYNVEDAVE